MSNAIAIKDDMTLSELGTTLAKSGYFQDAKDAAQACVKVLFGRELGFGPIASMTGIHIVKGRPVVGVHLISAAIKRSGRYNYKVLQQDEEACELAFMEQGAEVGRYRYTREDAERAGLWGRDTWKAHPRSMLFARAMGQGYRTFCPDVFGLAVYAEGEFDAAPIIEPEVIREEPASLAPSTPGPRDARVEPRPTAEQLEAAPVKEPPRKPANAETGNITTSTTIGPEWAAVLDAGAYQAMRGKPLHDEDVNGRLVAVYREVLDDKRHLDDRMADMLQLAMSCASRRYQSEAVRFGMTAETYAECRGKLRPPIEIPYSELTVFDRKRVRDWFERRADKEDNAPAPRPNKASQKGAEKRAQDQAGMSAAFEADRAARSSVHRAQLCAECERLPAADRRAWVMRLAESAKFADWERVPQAERPEELMARWLNEPSAVIALHDQMGVLEDEVRAQADGAAA